MTQGVLYLNHGTAHLARLIVSIWSLRQWWRGPVAVCDTGQSGGLIDRVAADPRLDCDIITIPLNQKRRNSCYCTKPTLWRYSPFDCTLLLDADTVVAGDPSAPLEYAGRPDGPGVVLTQFSWWTTSQPIIQKRIERWRGLVCQGLDVDRLVDESFRLPHQAINTGVVAWRRDCEFLEPWERLTNAGWRLPFTDELAAQLLARRFPHFTLNDRYNSSPIYRHNEHPVIHHLHGDKHVAGPNGRGEAGHAVWWPWWRRCLDENVGNVIEWGAAGDARLVEHMRPKGVIVAPRS